MLKTSPLVEKVRVVPKSATNGEIRVQMNIKPVKLSDLTPAQRTLVKKFWTHLILQVKEEFKSSEQSQ